VNTPHSHLPSYPLQASLPLINKSNSFYSSSSQPLPTTTFGISQPFNQINKFTPHTNYHRDVLHQQRHKRSRLALRPYNLRPPFPRVETTFLRFPRIHTGFDSKTAALKIDTTSNDPFTIQRNDAAVQDTSEKVASPTSPTAGRPVQDRRRSADEWGTYPSPLHKANHNGSRLLNSSSLIVEFMPCGRY
jgi:hypothetical protein